MMLSVLNHTNKGFFDGLVGEGGGGWQKLETVDKSWWNSLIIIFLLAIN